MGFVAEKLFQNVVADVVLIAVARRMTELIIKVTNGKEIHDEEATRPE